MRILQIHPFLRSESVIPVQGGISRLAVAMTRCLIESGHEVAVFPWPEWLWGAPVRFGIAPGVAAPVYAPMAIPERRELFLNWKAIRRGKRPNRRKSSAWVDLCFFTGFRNVLREFRPQVIHSYRTVSDIPEFYRLLNPNIPLLLTHTTCRIGTDLNLFDQIIVLTQRKKEEICSLAGYPEDKVRVIDQSGAEALSWAGGKVPIQPSPSLGSFMVENVRIYNELVATKRSGAL